MNTIIPKIQDFPEPSNTNATVKPEQHPFAYGSIKTSETG
jgi:hypothetical protein